MCTGLKQMRPNSAACRGSPLCYSNARGGRRRAATEDPNIIRNTCEHSSLQCRRSEVSPRLIPRAISRDTRCSKICGVHDCCPCSSPRECLCVAFGLDGLRPRSKALVQLRASASPAPCAVGKPSLAVHVLAKSRSPVWACSRLQALLPVDLEQKTTKVVLANLGRFEFTMLS